MNTNKKGFTLIELLVVIVIIGILATISVATFGGYFKKARDAERQTVVQNVATIMKVVNATEESIDYSPNTTSITPADNERDDLDARLAAQGYTTPDSKNGAQYTYGFDTATQGDFFIAVCSEETAAEGFAAGTPAGVAAIDLATDCATPPTAANVTTVATPAGYAVVVW